MTDSQPRAALIDGERAVVWTDGDGQVRAARDLCPHRRAPLSAGRVVDGHLECPYHGWAYDGTGRCTLVPALGADARVPAKAQLELLDVPVDLDAACAAVDAVDTVEIGTATAARPADDGVWLDGDTPGLSAFWHPVARRAEAVDGLTVELLGRMWTLTTNGDGWIATDADGSAAWGATTNLDHLWIAPEEPIAPLPHVPEWNAEGWFHRRMDRVEGRFGVGLLLDNQLDAGHFAFVHDGTFGRPETALLPAAEIERHGTTVTSVMRVPIQAGNDPEALAGHRPIAQHRVMHYEFQAPLWLRIQLDYEDMGGQTLILFALTPMGAGRSRMDVDLLFRQPGGFTREQLDDRVAFEHSVVAEDLRLQRLFEDLTLPLDPTFEIHTKADRFSLQCRQLLRELLAG
jgi:phenylpropionate dioxygenase-like ring-hydroxylating dioxygenase large terminal subunit